jgi:hypothetical protein
MKRLPLYTVLLAACPVLALLASTLAGCGRTQGKRKRMPYLGVWAEPKPQDMANPPERFIL